MVSRTVTRRVVSPPLRRLSTPRSTGKTGSCTDRCEPVHPRPPRTLSLACLWFLCIFLKGRVRCLPPGVRRQLGPHHKQYFHEKHCLQLLQLEFAKGKTPPFSRVPFTFDPPKVEWVKSPLQQAVNVLLKKGSNRSPGFYSRLFHVPKKDGGNRQVIDVVSQPILASGSLPDRNVCLNHGSDAAK